MNDECLLECLRAETGRAWPASLTDLPNEDWAQVIRPARHHMVLPLVHHRLTTAGWTPLVPAEAMNALRQAHLQATARNLGLFHSLSHTLRALDDRQIPVIVLKGAHLAALEYEEIGLRSMGDVDLLVRRQDLGKALEVLEYLGYRQPHGLTLEPEQVGTHHLPPLVRSGAPMLELHWALLAPLGPMARLVEPFAIDQDAVWRRSEQATIAGAPARVLSSVDLLLLLSVHLVCQHALQFGVRTASDIDALVRRSGVSGIDWQLACQRAREWHVSRCTYLTLALSRNLLGTPIPDDALSAFAPAGVGSELLDQARKLAMQPIAPTVSPNVSRLWHARGWRERLSGIVSVAFPSRRLMAAMYPASARSLRIYLYYPVRIKDLVARYGRTFWRLVRGDPEVVTLMERDFRVTLLDWAMAHDDPSAERRPAVGQG